MSEIVPIDEKRQEAVIDEGFIAIMKLCEQMGMRPSENIQIQFRLVLYGVLRLWGDPRDLDTLEGRITALEARDHVHAPATVPNGQAPADKEFKP